MAAGAVEWSHHQAGPGAGPRGHGGSRHGRGAVEHAGDVLRSAGGVVPRQRRLRRACQQLRPPGSAEPVCARPPSQVSALPEIAADAMRTEFRGRATLADGTELEFPSDSLHLVTPEQSAATGELDRSKVVRGRLPPPTPSTRSRSALHRATARPRRGGLVTIDLTDADGREVAAQTVEVTGVTVGALSLPSMSAGRVLVSELYASPALAAAYPAGIEPSWQVMSSGCYATVSASRSSAPRSMRPDSATTSSSSGSSPATGPACGTSCGWKLRRCGSPLE